MTQEIRSMKLTTIILFAAALGASACSKEKDAATATPAAPAATKSDDSTKHAPQGVKPGSHEDWCAEHAVPESQCTRCNPDLIAAFKATGDWCGEHGLPESQCLKCNPDLEIVRPPPSAGK
jgi:hypothetical protein